MADKVTLTPEVVGRFTDYYRENPTWGSLHCVLEEGNTQLGAVMSCAKWAEERGDLVGVELANLMLRMSKSQRGRIDRLVQEGLYRESVRPQEG